MVAPLVADPGHILYLAREGRVAEAVQGYRKHVEERGGHDFEVLHGLGVVLLTSVQANGEPEEQLLAAFGAGIAADTRLLPVLQGALASEHPQVQVAAVNLLAQLEDDRADLMLLRAMGSRYPMTRLEAGLHLAHRRHPEVINQLEAFMIKVHPMVRPLFPQLFVIVSTPESDRVLARFLAHPSDAMRRAAVLAVARAGRDDFLPEIRRLSCQIEPLQQEACAYALGLLQDSESIPQLKRLTQSTAETVRVAAYQALYQLGDESAGHKLQQIAMSGDPYAISALADIEGSEETLVRLLASDNLTTRINAASSLLVLRDGRCLNVLQEILVRDARDLGFGMQPSIAGALVSLRALPSASSKVKTYPALPEVSMRLRESILAEAANLPERDFLSLAETLFAGQQTDLIPTLVAILENMQSPAAIELLQRESQHMGAPLIRAYCNLALFRSHIDGPYGENLHAWIRQQWQTELIRLRPVLSYAERPTTDTAAHRLTPEETSRLLIEAVEAFAQRQDTEAVDILLETLEKGNPQNACPIAGLLIRITQ